MQLFTIHLMIIFWFGLNEVSLQQSEQIGSVQTRSGKRIFGLSETENTPAQFVTTRNEAAIGSPLILEAHQHVLPSKGTRFAHVATVVPHPVIQHTHNDLDKLAVAIQSNPFLVALLINTLLGLNTGPQPVAYNSPEHQPPNPYIALLLSHYGRYIPRPGSFTHGLYGYAAANNIHNTRPFGSYKIYDDSS